MEQAELSYERLSQIMKYFETNELAIHLVSKQYPPRILEVIQQHYPNYQRFDYFVQKFVNQDYPSELEFLNSIIDYFRIVPNLFPSEARDQLPLEERALVSLFEAVIYDLEKLKYLSLLNEQTLYYQKVKFLRNQFKTVFEGGFRQMESFDDLFPPVAPFNIFPSHGLPDKVNPFVE